MSQHGRIIVRKGIKKVLKTFRIYNETTWIIGDPKIGTDTWIGAFTLIDGSGGLEIGNHCSIASGVHIYTHDTVRWAVQDLKKDSAEQSHIDRTPVKIGNNCFIGANSTILRGVTIGDHCVIGAGSVVNKNIPAGSIAVGNPCRVIKSIADSEYADEKLKKLYGKKK